MLWDIDNIENIERQGSDAQGGSAFIRKKAEEVEEMRKRTKEEEEIKSGRREADGEMEKVTVDSKLCVSGVVSQSCWSWKGVMWWETGSVGVFLRWVTGLVAITS